MNKPHTYTGREMAWLRVNIRIKPLVELAAAIGVKPGALAKKMNAWRSEGYRFPRANSYPVGTTIQRGEGVWYKDEMGRWRRVPQTQERMGKVKKAELNRRERESVERKIKAKLRKEKPKPEEKKVVTRVQDYTKGTWVRIDSRTLVFKKTA